MTNEKAKEYRRQYYLNNKDKWVIWAKNNPEKKIKNQMAYEKRNSEVVKERKNLWISNNWEYNLWSQAQRRARSFGIEFTITKEDITIPTHCIYLGCELTRFWGKGFVKTNASIDRKDNSKGYTPDNIQIISWLANSMKRDATKEQLISFANGILQQEII